MVLMYASSRDNFHDLFIYRVSPTYLYSYHGFIWLEQFSDLAEHNWLSNSRLD